MKTSTSPSTFAVTISQSFRLSTLMKPFESVHTSCVVVHLAQVQASYKVIIQVNRVFRGRAVRKSTISTPRKKGVWLTLPGNAFVCACQSKVHSNLHWLNYHSPKNRWQRKGVRPFQTVAHALPTASIVGHNEFSSTS